MRGFPSSDPVDRIRAFNRAVTTEVGALDASFLGRGRPLGLARLLCAIGPDGAAVAALRTLLRLDAGQLARLLRGLEEEGLVSTLTDPADRRRRRVVPTEAGRREIAVYDRLSDGRALRLHRALGRGAEEVLAAMDRVAVTLDRERITLDAVDPEGPDAGASLAAYYAEADRPFAGGFAVATSLDPDAADLRPPRGLFLVAHLDGRPLGCAGLKGGCGATGEIKRVWVAPAARSLGLASRMMTRLEDAGRGNGMTRLRLDTNRALTEAIALYVRLGWREVTAFNDEPYAHHWFEKAL